MHLGKANRSLAPTLREEHTYDPIHPARDPASHRRPHAPGPHTTAGTDALWWLPVIGPTSTVLAFNLTRGGTISETVWPTDALARTIGLGANCSKLWHNLDRLAYYFGLATLIATDTITITQHLPRDSAHTSSSTMAEICRTEIQQVRT